MSSTHTVEEDICAAVADMSVSTKPKSKVPIALSRFQCFVRWAVQQCPSAPAEFLAKLDDTMCVYGSAQDQIDFFAKYEPEAQLAALAAEQKARAADLKPAAAKPARRSPEKGGKEALEKLRVTRTSLEGRPAIVDEDGTYYEPVVLSRAGV